MERMGKGIYCFSSAFLALALLASWIVKQTEAKPHIILMVLDDVGRADTGIYGESNIPVPRLNAIAKEGVIFENFHTQPVCSPTRSALMTGRYPFRFGMQHLTTQLPGMSAGVPLDVPMIPALLAKEGYERHAIGKWHLGYATWDHTPVKRGFQSYTGYLQAQGDYYTHVSALSEVFKIGEKLDGYDFWHNTRPYFEARGNYSVNIYQDAMRNVLRGYAQRQDTPQKQREHPLFIYMAHQTVHIPLQYRKEEDRCKHLAHKVRRIYCNMLVELDDAVGAMVDELKRLDLWDNTLILTLTDNGGMVNWAQDREGFPSGGASQGSNYPLRGSKGTLYDGGVRSLGFASGGYIPKEGRGRRVKELAHIVDFSATILTLGGVLPAKRERLRVDGHNLFDLIANRPGAQPVRDHIPINIYDGGKTYSAVRFGRYKLIVNEGLESTSRGWFDQNGDLREAAVPLKKGESFLFDLENDPYERKNLANEQPQLVKYGSDLIRNYVEGGDFMEPQDSTRFYVKALPIFHGGVWRPFMDPKDWQDNFNKEKAKYARKYHPTSIVSAEDDPQNNPDETVDFSDALGDFSSYVSAS